MFCICSQVNVGFWQIVLQKSPSGLCEIEICNYRIGAPVFLNRCCAFQPDLESIFLAEMLKILLQRASASSRAISTDCGQMGCHSHECSHNDPGDVSAAVVRPVGRGTRSAAR